MCSALRAALEDTFRRSASKSSACNLSTNQEGSGKKIGWREVFALLERRWPFAYPHNSSMRIAVWCLCDRMDHQGSTIYKPTNPTNLQTVTPAKNAHFILETADCSYPPSLGLLYCLYCCAAVKAALSVRVRVCTVCTARTADSRSDVSHESHVLCQLVSSERPRIRHRSALPTCIKVTIDCWGPIQRFRVMITTVNIMKTTEKLPLL